MTRQQHHTDLRPLPERVRPMAPTTTKLHVPMTPEMLAAIHAHCEANKVKASDLARRLLLTEIGRPELIDTMPPPGRPWPKKARHHEGT